MAIWSLLAFSLGALKPLRLRTKSLVTARFLRKKRPKQKFGPRSGGDRIRTCDLEVMRKPFKTAKTAQNQLFLAPYLPFCALATIGKFCRALSTICISCKVKRVSRRPCSGHWLDQLIGSFTFMRLPGIHTSTGRHACFRTRTSHGRVARSALTLWHRYLRHSKLTSVFNRDATVSGSIVRGDRTRIPVNATLLLINELRNQQISCQEMVRKLEAQTGLI